MIKIRKPKSKNRLPVNEDLSKTTINRKINKRKRHGLTDIANSVLQIKARRYEDLKKIYKRTMADYMSTKDINGVPLGSINLLSGHGMCPQLLLMVSESHLIHYLLISYQMQDMKAYKV